MTAVSPSLSLCIDPMPGDQEQYYGFTQFAVELNELDSTLRPLLPPTDTRFRPDQRSALFICLQWLFVAAISDHLAKKNVILSAKSGRANVLWSGKCLKYGRNHGNRLRSSRTRSQEALFSHVYIFIGARLRFVYGIIFLHVFAWKSNSCINPKLVFSNITTLLHEAKPFWKLSLHCYLHYICGKILCGSSHHCRFHLGSFRSASCSLWRHRAENKSVDRLTRWRQYQSH